MNILFVIHTDGLAGANRSLLQSIHGIIETYQSVRIYCIVPLEHDEIGDALDRLGCVVIPECFSNCTTVLYGVREAFRYYISLLNYRKIFKDIEGFDIDIVHTNTSVCDLGAYLAKRMGVPHIWHVRERMDYYQMSLIRPFHYRRQIESANTTVVCISNYIESYVRSRFKRIGSIVVYDPIDDTKLKEHSADINVVTQGEDFTNIIIAGILVKNKGIEDAINALNIIVNEYRIRNIRLYIVGASEDTAKYKDELKQMVFGYGLGNNVVIMPFSNDICKIRRKCSIALQCSIMEGLGRVTIESMLDDLFVIGARSGATIELIREGYNGWLYEPGNARNLAEKIRTVISLDSKTGDMIKRNANMWAKETFNTESITRKIMEVYNEALKNGVKV